MASTLCKQRDYKYMAENYSNVSIPQIEYGKRLIEMMDVKRGDKVLDMGCGTGELTAFIAYQVGREGQVLGVDPDQERIKVAVQNHSDAAAKTDMKFMVGDSSSDFPHHNEEHYDLHHSNFVFHWLTAQEKDVYLKTALDCLKPGGRIAIHSTGKLPEMFTQVVELLPDEEIEEHRAPVKIVEKSIAESMLSNFGFEILSSEFVKFDYLFSNLDHYLTWYCSSSYVDERKILSHKKEAFSKRFVNDNGTVYLEVENYRIIAKKIDNPC